MTQQLYLYNTRTRAKERFEPLQSENVRMYVCGPTVYDWAHIGNARPVVVFDVLLRLLRVLYPRVTYVRNITDIDDKIITAANSTNEEIETLTRRTTELFQDDMTALGALPPTHEPRATDHIDQMLVLIENLLDRGYAYEAEGHVLFHVPSMSNYGFLSRTSHQDILIGARVEVAPYKKDPADFVLWKPSKSREPGWESPWSRGRPGWHIECSAMSAHYLGIPFDIHGGGIDLVFPHHENECAQSICAHGERLGDIPLARFWLHNGFVLVNGQKMSKSLGNIHTVRSLLEEGWHGETIRLTLLSSHYRQPLDFTYDSLKRSKFILDRWYRALGEADEKDQKTSQNQIDQEASIDRSIYNALLDDLNIPLAFHAMHTLTSIINKERGIEKTKALSDLRRAGNLLGILQESPKQWFQLKHDAFSDRNSHVDRVSLIDIESLISQRKIARKQKNFIEADRIRDQLRKHSIIVEDHGDDHPSSWRYE